MNEAYAYDRGAKAFHWTMAAIIIVAIGIGLYAADLPQGAPDRRFLLAIHKSLGMTALLLLPLRFVWRMAKGEPSWRHPLPPLAHAAAKAGHMALYALMLVTPATGYATSAAGGYPLDWFGLFSFPRLMAENKALSKSLGSVHEYLGWTIAIVVAGHAGAALWHQFFKKDETLGRMTSSM
ncbi:MAG: cytochrome b [Hyphomicrobiales bacterium]|nr:cytochrome b [Hyphomicrobiales bacterium]